MITLLVVLASLAFYFWVGLLYARSQAKRLLAKARKSNSTYSSLGEKFAQDALPLMLGWRVGLWPAAVVVDAYQRNLSGWLSEPARRHDERIAQLRQDAEEWSRKAYRTNDRDEREAWRGLSRILREQADELEGKNL